MGKKIDNNTNYIIIMEKSIYIENESLVLDDTSDIEEEELSSKNPLYNSKKIL